MSFAEQLREQHKARQNRLGIAKAPVSLSFTRKPSVSIPITEKAPEPINVPVNVKPCEHVAEVPRPSPHESIRSIRRGIQELISRLSALEEDLSEDAVSRVRARTVILEVGKFYGVLYADLISGRRLQHIVRPRHIAMYLVKEMTLKSFPSIGRAFGGCDHSTTLHAFHKIQALRQTDPQLDADLIELTKRCAKQSGEAAHV